MATVYIKLNIGNVNVLEQAREEIQSKHKTTKYIDSMMIFHVH